jgi:potassium-dependent mechanosensitive channel
MKRIPKVIEQNLALIFAVLCALGALLVLPSQAVAQKKAKSSVTPTPQPQAQPVPTPSLAAEQAIQLPQIVARAEELNLLLREMTERLAPDPVLNSIDQSLLSQEELIRARQRETDELIAAAPTLTELQGLEQDWQANKNQYAAWRKTLTDRVKVIEEDVRSLADQQAQWEATLNQIQDPNAIEAVFDRIRTALSEIQAARSRANERLTLLVTLQNRVSQQDQVVTDNLEKIRQAKAQLQRSLLEPDGPPLWEASSRRQSDQVIDASLRRSLSRAVIRAQEFLKARRRAMTAIFTFFLAVLGINLLLRHRVLSRASTEPGTAVHLFQRPVSLALLTALIVALPLSSDAPALIRNLLAVLFVVPVLRFLPPLIHPAFHPLLYLLVVFGLTAGIWEMLGVPLVLKREVLAGLSLAAIAMGAWLIRPARIRQLQPPVKKGSVVIIAAQAALALVFCSLLANLFGYVALSGVLRSGAALSAFFAVVLYTAFIAIIAVFSLFWQTRQASSLSFVRTHGGMISKSSLRLLSVAAFVLWLYATLNFFTIRESVVGALSSVLTTPIKWGEVDFSLGGVLTFVLVFMLGVIFANIIRVILRADVLVRLPLKRGLPYAISTITYYLILLAVFLLALAAAGVELSRFTLLTGAFGVGAGFGLQNIINNFFSGIILLFERPIRIGDTLEVGSIAGDVERIGMRSTSIRTPQGAEVIVPNSILISSNVTNWTLTQQRRRAELTVEVASDTDPERVVRLLVEVAASHPDVLHDPKPTALFLGFGNNAINFELRFWVLHFRMHQQVKSELGMKVAAALRQSGIEMALPRQEMYVKSIDASVNRETLSLGASAPHGSVMTDQQRQEKENTREK